MSETSFVVESNKNQEQSEDEKTVDVVSPFPNDIENFDNPSSFPDFELIVPGIEKPLQLHRKVLAHVSERFKEILDETGTQEFTWPDDVVKKVDKGALVKVLRFCYGETMTVGTKNGECCAVIAALIRLQVSHLDDAVMALSNFAMEEAKRDIGVGAELLKACTEYKECCGANQCLLNKKLAAIVLSKDNMYDHYKEVVDDCLMVLPAEYLMLTEFGEPHTRLSEFCLTTRYLRRHAGRINKEDQFAIIARCDLSLLSSHELRELRLGDLINKDELLKAYEKALEYSEIQNERGNGTMKKMEKEMEKQMNEISIEREEERKTLEEYKMRIEMAEKETERIVKKAEMERKKYWNRVETLESYLRGNRLLFFHIIQQHNYSPNVTKK